MKIEFNDILNKHEGKTGYIIGMGPSLNENYEELIKKSNDNNCIIISCNLCDEIIPDVKVDYWVVANTQDRMNVNKNIDRYNKRPESVLVWAQSVDRSIVETITPKLKINNLPFNQNISKVKKWEPCKYELIQKKLMTYTKHDKMYSNGHTVAVHMMALSILLGLKDVFITGVDFDYSKGYANNKVKPCGGNATAQKEIDTHIHYTNEDIKIIFESGKNVGCKFHPLKKSSGHISKLIKEFY